MVVTYLQYSEEVLTDFFKFQILHKSKLKWLYFGLSLLTLAIGLLEIFVFESLVLGIIVCVLSVGLVAVFPIQIKRTLKKEVANMINHIDVELTFSSAGINQKVSEKRFAFDEWSKVIELIETKKYLYFYTNKYEAIIVTKSLLKKGEEDTLKELARQHNVKYKAKR